ncbi:hypothetical protein [Bradyrhizobium genomosp. III]|uniref:hypothetical protein n=1 Tax=Bradyrhizobium genomosp. III TaxID=2683271 RepID=UPI0005765E7D|nr:hypothetical protein [Bradyrhizobium sp. CCBAU 15635]
MYSETGTIYDVAKAKLSSDIRMEKAKVSLYRLTGTGILAAMIGAGVGLACFGYSYVADGSAQAKRMADALVQALEKANLTTTGEIKLADGSIVDLAPGGQVALAPGGMVRLDAAPRVKVARVVSADAVPAVSTPAPQAPVASEAKVVTHYTTFKSVAFGRGNVVTGWIFNSSNQVRPTSQYCYYNEPSNDKTHIRTDLGENGAMLDNLQSRVGVDLAAAFINCNWFGGT